MKMGLAEMGYPSLSTSLSSCSPIIQWPCCFQSPMLKHTHVPIKMLVSYYHIYYNHIYIYIHTYIYIYPMNNECHHSLSPFLLDNIPPLFWWSSPIKPQAPLGDFSCSTSLRSTASRTWPSGQAGGVLILRWFQDDRVSIWYLYVGLHVLDQESFYEVSMLLKKTWIWLV